MKKRTGGRTTGPRRELGARIAPLLLPLCYNQVRAGIRIYLLHTRRLARQGSPAIRVPQVSRSQPTFNVVVLVPG